MAKGREPLEGPFIDFFRPVLGFLFRTLVRFDPSNERRMTLRYAIISKVRKI